MISHEEVVKLIDACKNAGVRKLKYDKLVVTFHKTPPAAMGAPIYLTPEQRSQAIQDEIEADQDLADLELQSLLIENPMAFEEMKRRMEYGEERQRSERNVHPK